MDAGGGGLGVELLTEENVRESAFTIKVGMGIDEVAELFRLEAAAAVPHPVGPCAQSAFLPRGTDVIIFQKLRIPEMKVHRKAVDLDMHHERGGKVFV